MTIKSNKSIYCTLCIHKFIDFPSPPCSRFYYQVHSASEELTDEEQRGQRFAQGEIAVISEHKTQLYWRALAITLPCEGETLPDSKAANKAKF